MSHSLMTMSDEVSFNGSTVLTVTIKDVMVYIVILSAQDTTSRANILTDNDTGKLCIRWSLSLGMSNTRIIDRMQSHRRANHT